MSKIKNAILLLLGLAVLAAFSWSFFSPDFFRVHDYTHVARIVEMRRSLDAGHFPVHWTQNFGYGYGMPLFLFYGPLPFYLAAGLTYLGISALMAMKLTFFLSGVVAFLGMYLLMRRYGRVAGFIAATLLLTAPYRAVDLFVRGALNEAWAISFLPWLLYGGLEILQAKKRGVVITALATSAIILTHNLTAFLAIPLLGIATLVWQWAEKKAFAWKEHLLFIGGGLLGALMSTFYIVPAFFEKQFTIIESILTGYFDYHHHFLYIRQFFDIQWGYGGSEPGPNDGISFQLGIMSLLLTVLGGLFILRNLQRTWKKTATKDSFVTRISALVERVSPRLYVVGISGFLLALSLYMTLFHAQWWWETVPLLSFIQFPWRFLSVAIIFMSIIGGIAISLIEITPIRWLGGWFVLLLILLTTWNYHRPESFLTHAEDHYYTDAATIRTNMSDILPDYIPSNFDRSLPPVDEDHRIILDTVPDSKLELSWPQKVLWLGEAPEETTITWNIADFPGWKYFVNDQEVEPTLLEDGRRQLVSETAVSSVGAEFTMTPVRQYGTIVSALAWIFWLVLALPIPKKKMGARHAAL